MPGKAPSQAPGASSSELEGVEGTLPTLGNQAFGACLTTNKRKKHLKKIYFQLY